MDFFADFKVASRDILEKVGQEAALEDAEKDAKSEVLEFRDRFIASVYKLGCFFTARFAKLKTKERI